MRPITSAKFTPAAVTRMRISPVRGTGSRASRTSRTSGAPAFGIQTWRMAPLPAIPGNARSPRCAAMVPPVGRAPPGAAGAKEIRRARPGGRLEAGEARVVALVARHHVRDVARGRAVLAVAQPALHAL